MVLNWEPELRGEIYCSPACGGGCTKERHDEATEAAAGLALRLGRRWTPRVWENLGWHYCVISPCGRIKVHASRTEIHYTAFLGEAGKPGGYWVEHGVTPQEAVAKVIDTAKRDVAGQQTLVEGL